ncbi:MAG: acid phosphatase [Thermus sp.]|uniref:metallophosphoesterase family protein n=1 Tax=Thermus sp. TaxID=275 RepID=UPI00332CC732
MARALALLLLLELVLAQRLAVIGDWGAETPYRLEVASALWRFHTQAPLEALFTVGDNFYPRGRVVEAYLKDLPPIPLYPAFGNHDAPALAEQLDRFRLKRPFYRVKIGQVEAFVLYSEDFTQAQRSWLERALSESQAPWKLVLLHRPLYSSGLHGGSRSLRSALEPLLLRHRVALVLAGHDHHYERLLAKGLVHLVTGGGGAWPRAVPMVKPESQKIHVGPNFVVLTVGQNALEVQALDPSLEVLDRFSLATP